MSVQLTVNVQNNVTGALKNIQRKLDKLPQEAYKEFVKNTPIRTGNARKNTKLKNNNTTIDADYSYAGVLDKGRHMTTRGLRGSEQAPHGMTKPTVDFIKKRLKQIVKGR